MVKALWNTLWLSSFSGLICVVLGTFISLMELRRPSFASRALALAGVLPIAVPGLVYGVGLLQTFLKTPLYGTTWVLLLSYIALFLPYGIVVSRAGILQIHPELEESARMSGATAFKAMRLITAPLIKPTLISILFFVMLSSFKELSASLLLYTQRSQTLAVLTWNYMESGDYQLAAAIGVVQTLVMVGLVILTRAVFRVKLEKVLARSS